MPRPVHIAALALIVAGIACGSGSGTRACGGEGNPSCASLTLTAMRNAAWDDYCSAQPGCTDASEGLVVLLGPESASKYGDYDPTHLACSDVTFNLEDGGTETRHFILLEGDSRESFEIVEEVDVAMCLELES